MTASTERKQDASFWIDSILFSYAQIFFSNRRWFGGLALLATFVYPLFGIASLLGVILSNLIAFVLKFDPLKIKSGFYGFNGLLFGMSALYYYSLDFNLLVFTLIFIVISFLISAVLENYLAVAFNLPGLSLPFIITLYLFIVFISNYDSIMIAYHSDLYVPLLSELPTFVKHYFKSLGIILFQFNLISGLILAIAILFFSRILFLLSIISFSTNYLLLHLFIETPTDAAIIITSLNAILTSFALGGSLIIPSKKSFMLSIIATVFTIILYLTFAKILGSNLPILVLPFNLIVLSTLYSLKFRKDHTDLVLLYFTPGSPEENYYYHVNKKARFDKFKFLYPELPFFGEWKVSQGQYGKYTHKDDWKFAYDFVVVDNKNKEYDNNGDYLADYYCYKLPVTAPLDGEVVFVSGTIENNSVGNINIEKNWGNTIILKHEYELYSALSHLEPNSIKVQIGDKVKKGDTLALCGNSGRSPYPHLHFQFQLSSKLGDSTHLFPFAYFIQKEDDKLYLKTFDYPTEGKIVQNLDVHKNLKNSFTFKLYDKISFNCNSKDKTFVEDWYFQIDMYNNYYIINSFGDILYYFVSNKIFYVTSYAGSHKSALYYFYLSASQVPFSYNKNLYWTDKLPVSNIDKSIFRYASEIFLIFKELITVRVNYGFTEPPLKNTINLQSTIDIKGNSIFSVYERQLQTNLFINDEGEIESINASEKKDKTTMKTLFSCQLIKKTN